MDLARDVLNYGKPYYCLILMLDVLSVGSATEDVFVYLPKKNFSGHECIFHPGSKVEVDDMQYFTGGGATNTAVSFARLGLRAGAFFVVGNDDSGKRILEELRKEKVDVRQAIVSKKERTAYSVILTGFARDRVVLFFHGAAKILGKQKITIAKAKPKWVYISSLHGERKFLWGLIGAARKVNAKIAFNPGKKELALGISGLKRVAGKADVLVMNSREALMLTGSVDVHRNLKKLHELGKICVITDGNHGAHASDGTRVYSIKAFDVKVADVTGAGDAFASGFVAGIISGKKLPYCLLQGSANAASVVMHLGTKNKLLKKNEIGKFIRRHGRGIKVET